LVTRTLDLPLVNFGQSEWDDVKLYGGHLKQSMMQHCSVDDAGGVIWFSVAIIGKLYGITGLVE